MASESKNPHSENDASRFVLPTMSLASVAPVAMASGPGMLSKKTWAVVGNHAKNPVVERITNRLKSNGKDVHRVNSPGKSTPPAEFNFLGDVPGEIDVVDVVCAPAMGALVVEEASRLGIKHVWFQPGADDPVLVARAKALGMETHCGCVLVDLPSGANL